MDDPQGNSRIELCGVGSAYVLQTPHLVYNKPHDP